MEAAKNLPYGTLSESKNELEGRSPGLAWSVCALLFASTTVVFFLLFLLNTRNVTTEIISLVPEADTVDSFQCVCFAYPFTSYFPPENLALWFAAKAAETPVGPGRDPADGGLGGLNIVSLELSNANLYERSADVAFSGGVETPANNSLNDPVGAAFTRAMGQVASYFPDGTGFGLSNFVGSGALALGSPLPEISYFYSDASWHANLTRCFDSAGTSGDDCTVYYNQLAYFETSMAPGFSSACNCGSTNEECRQSMSPEPVPIPDENCTLPASLYILFGTQAMGCPADQCDDIVLCDSVYSYLALMCAQFSTQQAWISALPHGDYSAAATVEGVLLAQSVVTYTPPAWDEYVVPFNASNCLSLQCTATTQEGWLSFLIRTWSYTSTAQGLLTVVAVALFKKLADREEQEAEKHATATEMFDMDDATKNPVHEA